jgi:HTH-type transcriptional regulator/antitoxin HigA
MKTLDSDIQFHWEKIAPLLTIRNERDYDMAIKRMNELLDKIGTNEKHPLYSLLDVLGTLIYAYEEEHFSISERGFQRTSRNVLLKNAELYKRLSK